MALSLKESNSIAALAGVLCDFLPWSGNASWKGHVTFKTVADKVGVGDFWQPGSKRSMLTTLLERTFSYRRSNFQPLIIESVRAGISYRQKKNQPVTLDEIDQLNGFILELGFKFPDLWDSNFRNSLRKDATERAMENVQQVFQHEQYQRAQNQRTVALQELREGFFTLVSESDRNAAGLALEGILNRLFQLEGLNPRRPFRVTGEQIDGSFELDHETYLLEAKWEKNPLAEAPLLTFRGKIEGKSAHTRGLFISISGITSDAKRAIIYGKRPTFFIIDGHDLTMILSDAVGLQEFLRQRQRLLAEEGLVTLPYGDIWSGTRQR